MVRKYSPVLVLFLLSPLIAEVLLGATKLSNIGGFLPVSLLYGGGAVLIRELARRRWRGWGGIVLMGAAYGIIEEGLAIQSLFNPSLFNAGLLGGRALNVNWVWAQWTIGYHTVWSILIPIVLTELLFPARRSEVWLKQPGLIAFTVIYALGVAVIAAIFQLVLAPDFHASARLLASTTLVAAALVAAALAWPRRLADSAHQVTYHAPAAWVVTFGAAFTAVAWFMLLAIPEGWKSGAIVILPMSIVAAIAVGTAALVRYWSAGQGWGDIHRLAATFGALLVMMLFGFFFVTAGNTLDQAGQGIASLIAVGLLALFAWRLRGRNQAATLVRAGAARD